MSASERLQDMQSALVDGGVQDVKFCFAAGLSERPPSEVSSSVADFLDAYVKGRYTVVERIGDSKPQ